MSVLRDIVRQKSFELMPIQTNLEPRLRKIEGIKAVIFDIYGTLVISGSGDISLAEKEDRESAIREVLEEMQVRIPDREIALNKLFHDTIKSFHENQRCGDVDFPEVEIRDVWKEVLRKAELGTSLSLEEIESLAVRYEVRVNPVWPMPGLAGVLDDLRERRLSLGIISNAQFYTPVLFEAFLDGRPDSIGFDDELCIWSYEELRGKPSRELFTKCISLLAAKGIRPEQAIYVGNDMRNDIVPAGEAGMRTALFAGDARSLRLRSHDPASLPTDLILTDLEQLLDCIER